MSLSDLATNLISEAIGILVTVVFIDQLILWREKRKWRKVEFILIKSSGQSIRRVLYAWQDFLFEDNKTYEQALILWRKHFGFLSNDEIKDYPSHRKLGKNRLICSELESFLAKTVYTKKHWDDLIKTLETHVQELNLLIERHSTMINSEFAYPIVAVNYFYESTRYWKELLNNMHEESKHMYDKDICHCIICSVQLMILAMKKYDRFVFDKDISNTNRIFNE